MKLSRIFKACLNPKVLLGIGAIVLLTYLFAPQIASYAWILLVLACPLSMILMMNNIDRDRDKTEKLFICPECGFDYKEAEWAKKCAAWCREHHSCNLEITKHSVRTHDQNKYGE